MSCIKPPDPEPDFEPMNLNQRFMSAMVTAQSSPKLRLDLDDEDIFMDDADFDNIINKQGHRDYSFRMPNPFHETPLLPPSPAETGMPPTPVFMTSSYARQTQRGLPRDMSGPLHCDVPSLAMQNCQISTKAEQKKEDKEHSGSGFYVESDKLAHYRTGPKPCRGVPRDPTLTALPGANVIDNHAPPIPGIHGNSAMNMSTNMLPPPIPARGQTPANESASRYPGHGSRKRKLSFSSPFMNNFKRILTPISARKKPKITHLTHEATASNRNLGGVQNVGDQDMMTPIPALALPPTSATSGENTTPVLGSSSPAPVAGPDTPTPKTSRRSTFTSALQNLNPLHHARTLSHHSRTPSTVSTAQANLTSKKTLNALIHSLRSEVSDLTIENTVLKDQIAIVRQDWIETSQELDVERHNVFEGDWREYRLKLDVERLTGELKRLKRGSK